MLNSISPLIQLVKDYCLYDLKHVFAIEMYFKIAKNSKYVFIYFAFVLNMNHISQLFLIIDTIQCQIQVESNKIVPKTIKYVYNSFSEIGYRVLFR